VADKCSKHFSYRLKGKVGIKRSIPMTGRKSLATMFYRLKSGHAPAGAYIMRFGHQDNDKCWWCGGALAQMREHVFHHCSRWKDQQKTLCKTVGQATGWKAGRCRHMQISELVTIEECDQAVIDYLVTTEVEEYPPKRTSGMERAKGLEARGPRWRQRYYTIHSFFLSFLSFLSISHLSSVSGDEG
jgi:hypothetical protein